MSNWLVIIQLIFEQSRLIADGVNNPWSTQAIACKCPDRLARAGPGHVTVPAAQLVVLLCVHQERRHKPSEARPPAVAINEQLSVDYAGFRLQEESLSFGKKAST